MNIFPSVVPLSDDWDSLVSWSRYSGYAVFVITNGIYPSSTKEKECNDTNQIGSRLKLLCKQTNCNNF
jgi:hypothetical protein